MEKRNVLRYLVELGWMFAREGKSHEIWKHPDSASFIPVPRSKIIDGRTAKQIFCRARRYIGYEEDKLAA